MSTDLGKVAYDAIVIGAGPAGGTAALMLAEAGWSVALVEKRTFPRRKLCGEYLSATSLLVLRELGLGDAIPSLAGPEVRRAALFAGANELIFPMPKVGNAAGGVWGRAIGRERLDSLLLRSAESAGASLWQPWSATALERGNGGWICHLARRKERGALSASIVIAASGSWERGPVPVRPHGSHRPDDLLAFKGHFADSNLPDDLMPLLVFPGGYGGMVHDSRGGVNLSCCIRRDVLADARTRDAGCAGEAVQRHILANSAAVSRVLRRARRDGSWLSAGPINPGIRNLSNDGLFLVGNLAGEAHPIVAEGISMAIQSAWLLCRLLIARENDVTSRHSLAEVGTEYAVVWRRAFSGRLRAAAWFARLAMSRQASSALLPLLRAFPQLLTLGAEVSGKRRLVCVAQ